MLKEQKRAVLQTQSLLESALPELQQNYLDKIGKPIVRHYTGLMGLRTVFDEVYREGKPEVIGCVGNESPDEKLHQEIMAKYKPLRIKNKIFARSISPDTPRARELKRSEKQDLKEKILIDSNKYPMPAELDTWGDKVALMSFARRDFSGIMIEHKDFAITIQSLVRLVIDLSKNSSK